jgi:hypothetical protein
MLAFEVTLNGRRVCVAGAEDLSVLNTIISAAGRLGAKTVLARRGEVGYELFYSVGGLTSRPDPKKDVHLRWKSISPLKVGDVVSVKVVQVSKADRPRMRSRATPKRGKNLR